jgi:hypothetical protein
MRHLCIEAAIVLKKPADRAWVVTATVALRPLPYFGDERGSAVAPLGGIRGLAPLTVPHLATL